MLLHARGDGPGAERGRPRGARDRVLQRAVDVRLHVVDADAVQLGHAPLAALVLLPDDGRRRPRRHLRGDQGERAAVEVRRRPGQRLDQRARDGLAHQGHQRQEPGRGAVPEGGQRHRGRREPGRQAQGRGLRLPRDLAPRHRGVPRAAQEHRRRPPPHARHEHGQLDPRPVHEARDGRRRVDAVLALRRARPARQVRQGVRGGLHRATRSKAARGELKLFKKIPALQLWRKMLSMLFETGHPWITFKDACNVRSPQQHVGVVHSRNLCTEITLNTERHRDRGLQPGLGQPARAHEARTGERLGARPREAAADDPHRDAHARQRDRHQLLRGREGAQLEPASTARWASASWASRTACTCCARRTRRTPRWRFADARWRRSATTPTGPRPSSPRSAAATRRYPGSLWDRGILPQDTLQAAARGARRLRRGRRVGDAGLGRAARADPRARHAQLQLRGDRADGDDLQHHRRRGVDRARRTRTST